MPMKRIKGWLGVLLIFLFGVICGGVLASGAARDKVRLLIEGGPDSVVDAVVSRLRRDLKLDHDQEEMLQQIVLDTRIRLSAIRQKTEPEVDGVLSEAETKVRGILHTEQVRKFDEIVNKGHQRWHPALSPAAAVTPVPAGS